MLKTYHEEIVADTQIENVSLGYNSKNKKSIVDNDGSYTTKDLLNIENDVRSFALVLAAKDIKPPLAIALFGKWGSGKSFFMEQLAKRVDELSKYQTFHDVSNQNKFEHEGTENNFCKGVVQIKFNAWSYLDANLWAGLVTHIFEKLDEYVTGNNVKQEYKKQVVEKINERLLIAKSERDRIVKEVSDLNQQVSEVEQNLVDLEKAKKEIETESLDKNRHALRKLAVKNIPDLNAKVINKLKAYGFNDEMIDDISPNQLYDEVKSKDAFVRSVTKLDKRSVLVTVLFASVFLIHYFIPSEFRKIIENYISIEYTATISVLVPILNKLIGSYVRFKRLLNPVLQYKSNYLNERKKVEYERQKKLQQLAFNDKETTLEKEKLSNLKKQISVCKNESNHSISKRAFIDFISEKSKGEEYVKYLGLISVVRKDLEALSALFEEVTIPDDIDSDEKERLRIKQNDNNEFRQCFHKPLDRIILYIDDLDRCSDQKVLEVIQAVHLLMAFPLFNVVVGVDKRCLYNALIYKNLSQYSKYVDVDKLADTGIRVISPDEYLEKIFQIPFHLKEPEGSFVEGMVESLLDGQIVQETYGLGSPIHADDAIKSPRNNSRLIAPADLKLTPEELTYLKEFTSVVGSVPRTVKRFINIYRIIRAHQDFTIGNENKKEAYLCIMFLVALNVGKYRDKAKDIMGIIQTDLSSDLYHLMNNVTEQYDLFGRINACLHIREVLAYPCTQINQFVELVNRYSFNRIDAV